MLPGWPRVVVSGAEMVPGTPLLLCESEQSTARTRDVLVPDDMRTSARHLGARASGRGHRRPGFADLARNEDGSAWMLLELVASSSGSEFRSWRRKRPR